MGLKKAAAKATTATWKEAEEQFWNCDPRTQFIVGVGIAVVSASGVVVGTLIASFAKKSLK